MMALDYTLIVVRHSPYGSSLAKAALDTALTTAAFERPLKLLFIGEGVLQLLPDQKTAGGVKNIARQLASLPLYDIEEVFVDAATVTSYKLDCAAMPLKASALNDTQMQRLMAEATHVLGF